MPRANTSVNTRCLCVVTALSLSFATIANAGQGDLSIRIDDGLTHATPGRPITYTIDTRNEGPDIATGLSIVTSSLPPSCTWTCSSEGGECQTAPALVATLPAGAVAHHVASCTLPDEASASTVAEATVVAPSGFDDIDANNNYSSDSTQVVRHVAVKVSLTDPAYQLQPGNTVSYTVTATNYGPSTLDGAHVLNVVPPQYAACSWTCSGENGATCATSGQGGIDDTVTLPATHSVTYAATCTIAHNSSGTALNTATIVLPAGYANVYPVTGADTASDSNLITATGLADTAVEIITPDEYVVFSSNDYWTLNTRVVVSNRGSAPATVPVDISSSYANGWNCPAANCPFTSSTGGPRLRQTVTLPPHSRWELVAWGTGYGTGTVFMDASVGAPSGDPVPDNNAKTRLIYSRLGHVDIDSSIEIVSAPQRARIGDTVEYRFIGRVYPTNSQTVDTTDVFVVVPAYLTDAVPSCGTPGTVYCRILSSSPEIIGEGLLRYRFRLSLNTSTPQEMRLTGRVATRPYADYWNEVLSLSATIRSSGWDFNSTNNMVTVDTPLSLFRTKME
jgi:uncharacterized repeat protein (TIGR01451 family)